MSESSQKTLVGIDIGGSQTRLAVVDHHGRVLADRVIETPTEEEGDALVNRLIEMYATCREETDTYESPESLGVAVPGVLEPGRSTVVRAITFPNIEGLPLRDRMIEATGLRTVLEPSGVAAAWAEYRAREQPIHKMAYLSIGAGVNGAVIADGDIVRLTSHGAGHLGHIVCDYGESAPLCDCGAYGCLQSLLGGPALNLAAEAAGFKGGVRGVELAHQEGDSLAAQFIQQKATLLCGVLVTLIHIFGTELIVVGGGAVGALPSLVHSAAAMINDIRSALMPRTIRVDLGGLGDYASVVGAALLAAREFESKLSP